MDSHIVRDQVKGRANMLSGRKGKENKGKERQEERGER